MTRARTRRRVASACLALFFALAAAAESGAAAPPAPPIPVVAALEVLAGPNPPPRAASEARLARFAAALEADGRVRVAERVLLDVPLLGSGGADPRAGLRERALRMGSRYLVVASHTVLAGAESFDVQVQAVGRGPVFARAVAANAQEAGRRAAREVAALAARHARAAQQAETPPAPGTASLEELERALREQGEQAPQGQQPATPRVVGVKMGGQRRMAAAATRAGLRTREGEPLDPVTVSADIRRIYELGFFRDVQVLATDLRGGMLITFQVEENPTIRRVTITGNESMGSEDITEQLTLTVGSTVDYPLILQNEQRIEAMYQAKGFYQVEVTYSIEALTEDAVSVDYDVVEGRKLRLRNVHFEGNEALDDGELLSVMQTKPFGLLSHVTRFWDNSGLYAEPLFYQDLDRISRKYMDQGFIRVKVGEPEVDIHDKGLDVTVVIEEGPRYTVGSIDVLGDESIATDELLEAVNLVPGEVFSRTTLSDDVERLRGRYADRGFYQARVKPRTDVDPDALTVDVIFEVEKNELFFVDWIKVSGNTRTRDQVVRREVGLAEGELYSDRALERSRARVRRLGFFEEVSLNAEPTDQGNLGVTIDVVERTTGSFSFGAGFGSTDGFLVNASIRQDNLFGQGYAVSASVDMGTDNQFGSVRFRNPFFMGTPAGFGISGSFSDREFLDFEQTVLGFSVDLSYPLDEGETRGTVGYGFTSREVSGFSEFQAASLLQREEFQDETTTSLMTLSFRRDTRDDIRFPRTGQISGLALEFAGLGGISQFVRAEARTTWFWPVERFLGFDSTFIVNSRLGYVLPLNSIGDFDLPTCATDPGLDPLGNCAILGPEVQEISRIDDDLELPLTERYFLGGIGPFQVRGFEQRSLGPRRAILRPVGNVGFVFTPAEFDDFGVCTAPGGRCNSLDAPDDPEDFPNIDLTDVIGGNKMFLLNLELQFPISDELGLVGSVFFDMGNAFAEDRAIRFQDLRFGTGVGATWFSPFGPILVTLGVPLDPLEDEDSPVFEFSLGGQIF